MMNIHPGMFYEGSFADEKIYDSFFDFEEKVMTLYASVAQTEDNNGNLIIYGKLKIKIEDWDSFNIFLDNFGVVKKIPLKYIDVLDEIILFNFEKNNLILEGFGKKTLKWYKWIFVKPSIFFDEK